VDALWAALAVAIVTGLLSMTGKRIETRTSRAVEAQGAAADEWQTLAVFHRDRAEALDEVLQDERAAFALQKAALEAQVRGLEGRLSSAGLPIRAAPQPLDEPRAARRPVPEPT
jgi:hypothetical protein